jgi:hypothetical protein
VDDCLLFAVVDPAKRARKDSIANLPREQRRKAILEQLAYAATLVPLREPDKE